MIRSWGGRRYRWSEDEDALLMQCVDEVGYGIEAARLAATRGLDRTEDSCNFRLKSLRMVRGESAGIVTSDGGRDLLLEALVRVHGEKK